MKMNRKIIIIFLCVFFLNVYKSNSQPWMNSFENNPNPKFQDIENEFNLYWSNKDYKQKGCGWKPFKRNLEFWRSRVLSDGSFPDPTFQYNEYLKFLNKSTKNNVIQSANSWTNLGPNTSPGGYAGVGRINCVRTNGTTIWAGTPAGGLWKSTDGGAIWNPATDNLSIIQSSGVSDIAINPQNTNVMYIATGDADGGNTQSIGVFKSTDAGISWNETGLKFSVTNYITISKLLIHSSNPSVLLAGTNNGIYRSSDAGVNWTKLNSLKIKDMELRPSNPSAMYACGSTKFYKSTDDGSTWNEVTNGVPTNAQRLAIAVTPANTNYVYMVASNSSSGFLGFYKSTDAGANFTTQAATSPNILGYEANGSGTGGQGWYDLCIAANPSSANDVFVGGVNNWRTTDGGVNWTISTFWYQNGVQQTVHADKHDLFFSGSMLYCGNDGGVYSTSDLGTNWNYISATLPNTQFYKIGASTVSPSMIIGGAQDNGTKFYKNSVWSDAIGGDGMDCLVDFVNSNYIYGSLYYGDISKSTNGGNTFKKLNDGNNDGNYDNITESGAWVTPFLLDPKSNSTIYIGMKNIWKSTNGGSLFTKLTNLVSTTNIDMIRIAKSNSNYIFYQNNNVLNFSTDAGVNFFTITKPDNIGISDLTIDGNDENKLWVGAGGYTAGKKIYYSTDLGTNWINISGNFPNVIVNCLLLFNDGVNKRVYCGTDVGVFYSDNNDGNWIDFNSGLPYVKVTDLEVQKHTSKIIAGTYGRGIWEINLPNVVPAPNLIKPANLTINLNPINTELLWSSVPNALTYDISIASNPDFSSTISNLNLTNLSTTITNLNYNKNYYWRVRANTSNGAGTWSSSFTFKSMLSSPTIITPDNSTINIALNGTFNWNTVQGANYYELKYSNMPDLSNSISFSNISASSFSYSNFENTQLYYWTIKAKSNLGDTSDWAGTYSFTTLLSVPDQISPSNGTISLDTAKVVFKWNIVPKTNTYSLLVASDSNFTDLVLDKNNLTSNTFQLNNLNIFRTYYWKVSGKNSLANSLWSNVYNFRSKMEGIKLLFPETSTVAIDKNSSTFLWSNRKSSLSYDFQVAISNLFLTNSIEKEIRDLGDSLTILSNLKYNTSYYWRVKGRNRNDSTDWTSTNEFLTMLKEPILLEPINNKLDLDKNSKFKWSKVESANLYSVQISNSNNFSNIISTSTFTDTLGILTNLNSDQKYYWRTKAINLNNLNFSDWSSPFAFNTLKDITKPSLISPPNLSVKIPIGKVRLTWQKFTGATSYVIEISKEINFGNNLINTEITETTYDFNIIDNYTLYYWRVKAKTGNTSSEWTDIWNFKSAIGITLLNSPINNIINLDTAGILKLNANLGAKEYYVQLSEKSDFSTISNTFQSANTSFQYASLKSDTKYYWRAKTYYDNDTSAFSEIWNFTTKVIKNSIELDNSELYKFTINPNPVSENCEVNILLPNRNDISLEIVNIKGQIVKSILNNYFISEDFKYNINTSQIQNGTYYLKLIIDGKQKIIKFEISR